MAALLPAAWEFSACPAVPIMLESRHGEEDEMRDCSWQRPSWDW
ncbi:hypothetical protein ACIBH1_22980 [Nonomuraea sp. NPDC050663]